MSEMTCAVETATGRFLSDSTPVDGVAVIRISVSRSPDERRERWSGQSTPNESRAATLAEIADYDTEANAEPPKRYVRDPRLVATVAMEVRGRNIPAWTAMTAPQKKAGGVSARP